MRSHALTARSPRIRVIITARSMALLAVVMINEEKMSNKSNCAKCGCYWSGATCPCLCHKDDE
jgi:hypothetical protein